MFEFMGGRRLASLDMAVGGEEVRSGRETFGGFSACNALASGQGRIRPLAQYPPFHGVQRR